MNVSAANPQLWRVLRLLFALVCLSAAATIVWTAGLPDRATVNAVLQPGSANYPAAPEIGALAPAFVTTTTSGNPLSLSDLRGTPVMLNFWATWCGPCLSEMPMIQTAYDTHHAAGLRVIAVDSSEPLADVLAWDTRFGLTYDTIIDNGLLADLYRLRGLPTTFFIGRDGVIQQIVYGPLTDQSLDSAITSLLR